MRIYKKYLLSLMTFAMVMVHSPIKSKKMSLKQVSRAGLTRILHRANARFELNTALSKKTFEHISEKAESGSEEIRELKEKFEEFQSTTKPLKTQLDADIVPAIIAHLKQTMAEVIDSETQSTGAIKENRAVVFKVPQVVFTEPTAFASPTLPDPKPETNIPTLSFKKIFYIDTQSEPIWHLSVMFNKFISNLGPLFTGAANAGLVLNDYGTATIGVKPKKPKPTKLDPKLNRPFNSYLSM